MQRAVLLLGAMCDKDFMKLIKNALPKFRVGHGFRDLPSTTEDYYDDLEYNAAFTQIAALDRTTYEEYESTEEELKRSVQLGLEKCNLFYEIDWVFSADNDLGEPMSKRPKIVVAPPEEHLDDIMHPEQKTLSSVNTTDMLEVSMVPKEATKEAFPADFDQGDPGSVTTDRGRQDPDAAEREEGEDKGSVDPGDGRVEGETETKEDHMQPALGFGEAVEYDDAHGQDEGFKEEDQVSREGERKRGLTREWFDFRDMLFYDSEVDGDEGFDEDE